MLKTAAKGELLHVPFRGPAPAKQAVLAGDVSLICDNLSNVINDAREGTLKAIALTAQKRHPRASEIATSAEQGFPALDAGIWYSFVVPASTPRAIVDRLNREIAKTLKIPEVEARLGNLGLTVIADKPEEFGKFMKAETQRWKEAIEAAGVKID